MPSVIRSTHLILQTWTRQTKTLVSVLSTSSHTSTTQDHHSHSSSSRRVRNQAPNPRRFLQLFCFARQILNTSKSCCLQQAPHIRRFRSFCAPRAKSLTIPTDFEHQAPSPSRFLWCLAPNAKSLAFPRICSTGRQILGDATGFLTLARQIPS